MPWLVIGCGNTHQTHVQHQDITMDTDAAMQPTHVGSITDPDSPVLRVAQYRRHFDVIFFENISEQVFSTPENCRVVVTHLCLLLRANGEVRIRGGLNMKQHLPKLRNAFKAFGFAIQNDIIRVLDAHYHSSKDLDKLGLVVSQATQGEQSVDFIAKKGAGVAAKPHESPI